MALLFLSNKLINLSDIKFVQAENQTEKVISTYSKFKYEQALLGFEFSLYVGFYAILTRRIPPRFISSGCSYNYEKSITQHVKIGSLIAFPISIYRAIDYIKNNDNKQIIQF